MIMPNHKFVFFLRRRKIIYLIGITMAICLMIMVKEVVFHCVVENYVPNHFNSVLLSGNWKLKFPLNNLVRFNTKPSENMNQTTVKSKLILLWSPLFPEMTYLHTGKESFLNSGCLEDRCEITADRSRLAESDAVLFHVRTMSVIDVPKVRNPDQKWIFFSLEAPSYSRYHGLAFMYRMFNWTMTYRSDSDIVTPYGRIRGGKVEVTSNMQSVRSEWTKKSKMAVWMVSNCETSGNRESYIREMQKYIDVATFGQCGMAACLKNQTAECLDNFSKQFFFYLSFENAICDDYVTEKFFQVLNYTMIPVVFGAGPYNNIAPLGSYINAMDFSSPKMLSSHLLRVASNFSAYYGYFKWKMNGFTIQAKPDHCGLCEKLHSKCFSQTKVYDYINEWWIQKSRCRKWN